MTNPDRLEAELRIAGAERERIEKSRHDVGEWLKYTVKQSAEAGMSKTRIAELAGVSRQTVHEMLRNK